MQSRGSKKLGMKRLAWEYKEIVKNGIDGVCAGPVSDDNLYTWEAVIRGPEDSPYVVAFTVPCVLNLAVFVCSCRATFTGRVFGPAVDSRGKVPIDLHPVAFVMTAVRCVDGVTALLRFFVVGQLLILHAMQLACFFFPGTRLAASGASSSSHLTFLSIRPRCGSQTRCGTLTCTLTGVFAFPSCTRARTRLGTSTPASGGVPSYRLARSCCPWSACWHSQTTTVLPTWTQYVVCGIASQAGVAHISAHREHSGG